jgi:CelD/BcsL family acetyltransferase involved in cellulose biosynthesis
MIFSHTQDFSAVLKTEWDSLLTNGISKVPFLRYEYLKTWWQTRGGGEWPEDSTLLLIQAHEGTEIAGIAPCFISHSKDKKTLMLLGGIEISDYLDLLVTPEHVKPFARELLQYIKSVLVPQYKIDRIEFSNIVDQSPSIEALETDSREFGLVCTVAPLSRSPYIPLNGNYEDYMNNLDKKQRHEMRRKLRRVLELPEGSDWYIASDPATIENEIQDFIRLMAFDEDKLKFLTPVMREQMRLSMLDAFNHGILQLAFLNIGGQKAAAYLNFDFNNRIYVYNSGINPDCFENSPGWVLLTYLIKWANENNRLEFDFMRGTEDYKYKFGGLDRSVMQLTIDL